jgi:hypothetical protein
MTAQPREVIEGPEPFERFRSAMKAVLTVPMSAIPKRFEEVEAEEKTK